MALSHYLPVWIQGGLRNKKTIFPVLLRGPSLFCSGSLKTTLAVKKSPAFWSHNFQQPRLMCLHCRRGRGNSRPIPSPVWAAPLSNLAPLDMMIRTCERCNFFRRCQRCTSASIKVGFRNISQLLFVLDSICSLYYSALLSFKAK